MKLIVQIMPINKLDKIILKREIAYNAINKINHEKRRLNNEITFYEDSLRKIRKECPHPKKYVKKTETAHVKQCDICKDLIIY